MSSCLISLYSLQYITCDIKHVSKLTYRGYIVTNESVLKWKKL